MTHIPETLVFAVLVVLLLALLAAAFAPGELAALRRWRLRWRERRYAAYCYRHGVGLSFWLAQLPEPEPDRRIRTYPRHRLAGGGGR